MADHETPDTSKRDAEGLKKKPFEPPRLTVYGDIASLTKTVGRTGLADGGKGNTTKTRP
jgi:hypothetical protein